MEWVSERKTKSKKNFVFENKKLAAICYGLGYNAWYSFALIEIERKREKEIDRKIDR